jgi:hypothetical protein
MDMESRDEAGPSDIPKIYTEGQTPRLHSGAIIISSRKKN